MHSKLQKWNTIKQKSNEWYNERNKVITATDVSSILEIPCPAIPTGSQSPTAGSSPWIKARSPSAGRTIAPRAGPDTRP